MEKNKILNWVLAAILICGTSVFTACSSDSQDNPAQEQAKKDRKEFIQHTRATLKDLAENLNFTSWEAANMRNLYFNQYVLNNPNFNRVVGKMFVEASQKTLKPVEEGSELAQMGFKYYGTVDFSEFNYRFTETDDHTTFNVEAAEGFEVITNRYNPATQQVEKGGLKLTLAAGGGKTYKTVVPAAELAEPTAIVVIIPSEFQFAISVKLNGTWNELFTGTFNNKITVADDREFVNIARDNCDISGTIKSEFNNASDYGLPNDKTALNFFVSDNYETKEIKREFSFVQNDRSMLSIVANGHDEFGLLPPDPGTDMGGAPGMEEGGGPEKPDIDGDGKPDEPPTTTNSDSQLMTLLFYAVGGKSFDKLSLTLLDDLTTTMSISDCSRALQLAQEAAQARRHYADQQTIEQYTQELNELVKAEMTCKGINQTIPMKLVTTKFGVDWWTMPAFNFADENGYVTLTDLMDPESVAYGINIIDHHAAPMSQSLIVMRQLMMYVNQVAGTFLTYGKQAD